MKRSALPFVRGVYGRVREMAQRELGTGRLQGAGPIRGAVVGHDPLDAHAVGSKPRDGAREEADRVGDLLRAARPRRTPPGWRHRWRRGRGPIRRARLRWRRSPVTRCPGRTMRPSAFVSTCRSSPGDARARSARRVGRPSGVGGGPAPGAAGRCPRSSAGNPRRRAMAAPDQPLGAQRGDGRHEPRRPCDGESGRGAEPRSSQPREPRRRIAGPATCGQSAQLTPKAAAVCATLQPCTSTRCTIRALPFGVVFALRCTRIRGPPPGVRNS